MRGRKKEKMRKEERNTEVVLLGVPYVKTPKTVLGGTNW
jgi:hypothetical protein